MAKISYGAGPKPRKKVEKKSQDTSNIYGGNRGANKGKSYSTGDNAMKKTKGYDALTSETKERRGSKGTGKTKYKSKTTGQKARSRSANRRNKAKGGN